MCIVTKKKRKCSHIIQFQLSKTICNYVNRLTVQKGFVVVKNDGQFLDKSLHSIPLFNLKNYYVGI